MTRAEALAGYVASYWQWMRYREMLQLSLVQSEILLTLLGAGRPVEVRELAADLERSRAELRREVCKLLEAQLVVEVPHAGRRPHAVQLTPAGFTFLFDPCTGETRRLATASEGTQPLSGRCRAVDVSDRGRADAAVGATTSWLVQRRKRT